MALNKSFKKEIKKYSFFAMLFLIVAMLAIRLSNQIMDKMQFSITELAFLIVSILAIAWLVAQK